MRVPGLSRVYAAGDATWFPVKQGGIAAQQADAAASAIAALAGAGVEPEQFRPVLRAAILTGSHPLFLRSSIGARDVPSVASEEPLWWPPSKVAGKYLASYIRDFGSTEMGGALEDLDEPLQPEPPAEGEYRETVELALKAADLDAADHDFRGALRWLQVAEDLEIALPSAYAVRREQWRRAAEA
jgi:sulfide:quinone oxidoreductase